MGKAGRFKMTRIPSRIVGHGVQVRPSNWGRYWQFSCEFTWSLLSIRDGSETRFPGSLIGSKSPPDFESAHQTHWDMISTEIVSLALESYLSIQFDVMPSRRPQMNWYRRKNCVAHQIDSWNCCFRSFHHVLTIYDVFRIDFDWVRIPNPISQSCFCFHQWITLDKQYQSNSISEKNWHSMIKVTIHRADSWRSANPDYRSSEDWHSFLFVLHSRDRLIWSRNETIAESGRLISFRIHDAWDSACNGSQKESNASFRIYSWRNLITLSFQIESMEEFLFGSKHTSLSGSKSRFHCRQDNCFMLKSCETSARSACDHFFPVIRKLNDTSIHCMIPDDWWHLTGSRSWLE